MPVVYIVRCNFSDPNKEWDWNDWYSGPKIKQMLAKPFFRTGQRFRMASGTGRPSDVTTRPTTTSPARGTSSI